MRYSTWILSIAALVAGLTGTSLAAAYTAVILPSPLGDPGGFGIRGTQYVGSSGGSDPHALLWDGTTMGLDLNPSGYDSSGLRGTSGGEQVGWATVGRADIDTAMHAMRWSGTGSGAVDLGPTGFRWSTAQATNGTTQVGYGIPTDYAGEYGYYGGQHALLWTGTADSAVDLNPDGFTMSQAYGICGNQEVGYGASPGTGWEHALLWTGTPESAVDLNPSGYTFSWAYGTSGTQQVGCGWRMLYYREALLWSGTPDTAVNLHPDGFDETTAYATNGIQQVGYGSGSITNSHDHALVWSGTADSIVDLHQFLPDEFNYSSVNPSLRSYAYGINDRGDIVGVAFDGAGYSHAVVWVTPEPATMGLLALGGLAMLLRVRRSRVRV